MRNMYVKRTINCHIYVMSTGTVGKYFKIYHEQLAYDFVG